MKHIVVGDVHGNQPRFLELMTELGVSENRHDRINAGVNVIQLGDFLNLGYGQEEVEFWNRCRPYVDVLLVGNHELPVIAPRPQYVRFMGFELHDREAANLYLQDKDNLHGCAFAVGDWLITHAGLNMRHKDIIDMSLSTDALASELNSRFTEFLDGSLNNNNISLFEDQESLFWTRAVKDQHIGGHHVLKEIVGHTPQVTRYGGEPQSFDGGDLWIIDIGAKVSLDNGIAALVTEDDGKSWELTEIAGVTA